MTKTTPPIAEILFVKNVRAFVVCGFLMKWFKKDIMKIWKKKNQFVWVCVNPRKTILRIIISRFQTELKTGRIACIIVIWGLLLGNCSDGLRLWACIKYLNRRLNLRCLNLGIVHQVCIESDLMCPYEAFIRSLDLELSFCIVVTQRICVSIKNLSI